jgi:Rps23 Pro-64 3,4-dihydroxylase Tpa1-like proline 4-hydroxylase
MVNNVARGPSSANEVSRASEERFAFALNPALDVLALAGEYARRRRVRIPGLLASDGAERLRRHLRERADWRLVINQGDQLFELDREAQAHLEMPQREQLEQAVNQAARYGFQFRFEIVRVPDGEVDRIADASLLADFARWMSSNEVLGLLREITGLEAIRFADAQGTAYGPRDFLTAHDDEVAGKSRAAAYVMNLTPEWRADWGGLLMFHSANGHVEEAWTPQHNALSLFAVPQAHSVSYVTPFIPNRRYSVTGWLRTGQKP